METSLSSSRCVYRIAFGDIRLMASKKKPSVERSGECYRHSWFRSLSWVFGWTVLFSPVWLLTLPGVMAGLAPRMRELGMENYNEFLFGAGVILAMASVTLGLLVSELFSRAGRGWLLVGLSGIAVFFLSLLGGSYISTLAFYVAAQ